MSTAAALCEVLQLVLDKSDEVSGESEDSRIRVSGSKVGKGIVLGCVGVLYEYDLIQLHHILAMILWTLIIKTKPGLPSSI